MKRHKIGILTLAFTLISLGGILLTKNFIDINTSLLISILWPSIIIFFGFEIIITKLIINRKKDDIKVTVDSLSIILLFIIIIGIVLSQGISFFRVNMLNIFTNHRIFYSQTSKYSFDYEYDPDGISKIDLNSSHGNIEIKKISGDKIRVNAEVKFNHNDYDYADEISDKIVVINKDVDGLYIRKQSEEYTYRSRKINGLKVSYIVEVPKDVDIGIVHDFGNIFIENCAKEVDINSEHTDISLIDIDGKVDIENSHGYVDVEKVRGIVKIYNKHGKIDVREVNNDIIIENSHARINAEDIKGNVNITNSHDSINVKNVTGDIDIDNKHSNIKIEGANQGIKILNRHGDIICNVESPIKKFIEIKNDYGSVNLTIPENQEGRFKAYVKYGNINNEFEFNIDKNTNSQSLLQTIGKENVTFDIDINHGNLYINN